MFSRLLFILGPVLVFGNKPRNWGITKLWGMTFATLETISGPRVIRLVRG